MAASSENLTESLEALYPHLTRWILDQEGTIELGSDEDNPSNSMARVFDSTGLLWESQDSYESLDDLFDDLESVLAEEFEDVD
ncbi:MAG: hypothetical protein ACFCU8_20450 [Thermosynechococcaceae cyanobacterium]